MLCQFCQCLDLGQACTNEGYAYHAEYKDTIKSAETGCEGCRMITQLKVQRNRLSKGLKCFASLDGSVLSFVSAYQAGNFSDVWSQERSATPVYTTEDDPLAGLIHSRPIYASAEAEALLDTVANWLQTCLTDHDCAPVLPDSPMRPPSRVLDVGDEEKSPFLVTSQTLKGGWAALSHCWGRVRPMETLTTNLDDRRAGIPLTSLPKTFRDAVIITRRLGLRYLWIDSLCILQDSVDDWFAEATRMAYIYTNATVTIAAEATPDCTAGIFDSSLSRRTNLLQNTTRLPCKAGNRKGFLYCQPSRVTDHLDHGILNTRAWTYQEDLLSPRIVRFSEQEIYWKCQRGSLSETCPTSCRPDSLEHKAGPSVTLSHSSKFRRSQYEDALSMRGMSWFQLVNEYVSRSLTFPEDVFPSLSGVARKFYRDESDKPTSRLPSQTYLAGLWLEDIHRGLQWTALHCERQATYIAPSWSWAALKHKCGTSDVDHIGIYHDYLDRKNAKLSSEKAEVLAAEVQNMKSDPFSVVLSGYLKLRGHCSEICSCLIPQHAFDISEDPFVPSEDSLGASMLHFEHSDLHHDEGADQHHALLYFQIERRAWSESQKFSSRGPAFCLVLERVNNRGAGVFRRVGINMIYGDHTWALRTVTVI
ncbi:hypothetical protein BP5796_06307 [Coleophoma crateriformis]|uniref:Heterokaryon incompatibility domain-containing protein n=1 Tax=Coleophoma crateriformis TaxID=565419 RepID=A0A3D8RWR6_9HELO|nr:hypothetical protein BP5796_06307 [Coleophoma crateriformis]